MIPVLPMSQLAASWASFWGGVSGSAGSLFTLLAIVGTLIVVLAAATWIYRKSRGGGGNTSGLLFAIIIGGLLAAPNVIIPALLTLADFFVNAFTSLTGVA